MNIAGRNRSKYKILYRKVRRVEENHNGQTLPASVIHEGKNNGPRNKIDTNNQQELNRQIVQRQQP